MSEKKTGHLPQSATQYWDPPPPYTPTPQVCPYPTADVGNEVFSRNARFDGISQRTVPPAPPGIVPNIYQQYGTFNQPYPSTEFQRINEQTVLIGGTVFAKQARFDGIAQPRIPPPPPGVFPNPIQMMAAQGQNVQVKIDNPGK